MLILPQVTFKGMLHDHLGQPVDKMCILRPMLDTRAFEFEDLLITTRSYYFVPEGGRFNLSVLPTDVDPAQQWTYEFLTPVSRMGTV